MIGNQPALLKRELWEHRSIYLTPAVIGLLVVLLSVTGQVTLSSFDMAIDGVIIGASNLGPAERAAGVTLLMTGVASFVVLAMWVLTVFYALDSLYAERKERSILFWRSLPCTDTETVLSKLVTALLVIPVVSFVAIVVTQLLVLAVSSVWIAVRGADAGHLLWSAAPLFENWLATFVFLLATPLWLAPFIGWFLLVSAWAKRSPLLVAFLPILVLPMLERTLLGSTLLVDAFFVRTGSLPLFRGMQTGDFLFMDGESLRLAEDASVSLLSLMDLGRFFGSGSLWLGLVVCGLFTAAAIYVRRYRDDS